MNRPSFHPIRAWKDKLLTTAVLLAVVVGMKAFSVTCPFLSLTRLPCPTCGMTRAWIAALQLDFSSAFAFHPLFWTVPLLYLCFLYDGRLFRSKWGNIFLYTLLAAAFGIWWGLTLYRTMFL